MNLGSNQTYSNQTFNNETVEVSNASNISFDSCIFHNVSFKLTDCSKINFKNSKFYGSGPGAYGGRVINIYGSLDDSEVTGCEFHDINCDSVIFCDNGQISRSKFNWNKFYSVTHGMHFSWGGVQKKNDVEIAYNEFHQVKRFALEMQNAVDGLDIHHNWADDFQPNDSRMTYSIATGRMDSGKGAYAQRVHIHDNWWGDPARSTNHDTYAACEVMGANFQVHNNAAKGPYGCILLYGWNHPDAQAYANVWEGGTDPKNPYKGEDGNERLGRAEAQIVQNLEKPTPTQVFNNECWWQDKSFGAGTKIPSMVVTASAPGQLTLLGLSGKTGKMYRRTKPPGDAWRQLPDLIVDGQKTYIDSGPDSVSQQPTLAPNWEYFYEARFDDGTKMSGQGQVSNQPIPNQPAPNQPAPNQPIPNQPIPNQPAPTPHVVVIDGKEYEPKE